MFSIDIENGISNEYIKVISDEKSILWYLLLGLDIAYFNLRLSVTGYPCMLIGVWRHVMKNHLKVFFADSILW